MEKMLAQSELQWGTRSENVITVVYRKDSIMQDGLTCVLLEEDSEDESSAWTDLTRSKLRCGPGLFGKVTYRHNHFEYQN